MKGDEGVGASQLPPRTREGRRGFLTDNQLFTKLFSIDSASCQVLSVGTRCETSKYAKSWCGGSVALRAFRMI